MTFHKTTLLPLLLLAGCAVAPMTDVAGPVDGSDWPALRAPAPDAAMEARIARIVAGMTLAQKIGQITQPDVRYITPDEVRQYYIGSVLNGGGAWPASSRWRAATSTW